MFLPFHDDNPTRTTPFVTYALIVVNALAFLWLLQLGPQQRRDVTFQHGFVPARIEQLSTGQALSVWQFPNGKVELKPQQPGVPEAPPGGLVVRNRWGAPVVILPRKVAVLRPDPGEIYLSLLTCMFMHGGWLHLIGNMWFLWLFGNNVEDRLGHVSYLIFYLVGGFIGSFAHWAINPESTSAVIGASGAVAAVLGAYAITWPWARVHTLIFIIIFIDVIDVPALGVLGLWFLLQLIEAHGQLGLNVSGGVAWWAHVGGFVAGMVLMPLLSRLLGRHPAIHPTRPTPEPSNWSNRDQIIDVQILHEDDGRNPRR